MLADDTRGWTPHRCIVEAKPCVYSPILTYTALLCLPCGLSESAALESSVSMDPAWTLGSVHS